MGGNPVAYSNVRVRLEGTIGIYGTGLIDAIPDDSRTAQYAKEEAAGVQLDVAPEVAISQVVQAMRLEGIL